MEGVVPTRTSHTTVNVADTSREEADPLWTHPCDDDRRLAVAVA